MPVPRAGCHATSSALMVVCGAVGEAAFADATQFGVRRERAQRRVGEGVEQHHLGLREHARTAQRDQVGRARSGTDKRRGPCHIHAHGVAQLYSAPLVRLLAGSTTISAPPTRLVLVGATGSGCQQRGSTVTWLMSLTASSCASVSSSVWMSRRWSIALMRACTQRLPWRTQYLRPISGRLGVQPGERGAELLRGARMPCGVAIQSPRLETSSWRSKHHAGRLHCLDDGHHCAGAADLSATASWPLGNSCT